MVNIILMSWGNIMKRITYWIVSVLMSICLVICSTNNTYALYKRNDNLVTISVLCNNQSIITSQVKIKVYESTLSYSDVDSGYREYVDEELFEITASRVGTIEFDRPSGCFTVSIELNSLPEDYGVVEKTHFFEENENSYQFILEKIENIEIKKDGNDYYACFSSAEGKQLFSEYDIYEENYSCIDHSKDKYIEVKKSIIVEYCGKEYVFSDSENNPYASELSKAEILYSNKEIDESKYVQAISKSILGLDEEDELLRDGTNEYWILHNYIENNIEEDITEEMRSAYSQLAREHINRSDVSVASNSGHFRVYYDNDEVTEEVALAVANEYDSIDNLFCSIWGFIQPYYNPIATEYRIYLVPRSEINNNAASTPINGGDGSYIKVAYETAINVKNGVDEIGYEDKYKGVLAHEYMHAIFYRYGIEYDTDEKMWMHESFASWAGIVYENDYVAFRTNSVRTFLNSPEKTLTYFTFGGTYGGRQYGSCLFPLYIYENFGGYQTIISILQAFSSSSDDPLTAINTGLQLYGYSLSDAYTGCATYNYDASYYYSVAPPRIDYFNWGGAKLSPSNAITTYPNTMAPIFLEHLACRYTKFEGPSTPAKLTVTVSFSNYSNRAALRTIRKNSSGNYYISSREVSSGQVTIIQNNFGGTTAKELALVPMNISTTEGVVGYTWSASLSSGSSSSNYKITNVGANKCLNIYGSNVTSLYNHQNVCLWSDSGSNEQKWYIPSIGTGVYIKSIIDTSYGLNVYRVGSPWNCDMYPISGNETDAQVDFIVAGSGYKIKLHNYNLYLTADASSNGSNVYWGASSSSSYQIWRLDLIT